MMALSLCLLGVTDFHNHGTRPGVARSFDCEVRQHAFAFARATLPERGSFRTAFEALQLQACGLTVPHAYDHYFPPRFGDPGVGLTFHVDSSATVEGDGSATRPFRTLEAAIGSAGARPGPKTVLLRAGTYNTAGVTLTAAHSDLTIRNADGADVVISGAVPVANAKHKWSLHEPSTNTWRLDLSGQGIATEYGLRVEGARAIRAKYPNGDPERAPALCEIPWNGSIASPGVYLNGSGVSEDIPTYFPRHHEGEAVEYWARPTDWPGVAWHEADADHPRSIGGFGPFFYAAEGVCSGRRPSHGYWCSPRNPRGALGQHPIDPPGGFYYDRVLPQAAKYARPQGAVFHARGGSMPYFSYMCLVKNISDGKVHFDASLGCDQGGPTPDQPGKAWDWFIENVKEECDSPGEYFYDAEEEALYYTFNSSRTPTGAERLALVRTKVLINISGTRDAPVRNVRIEGLTLRDAALTYLGSSDADVHWLPSEGDWALQRSGAISIEGAVNVTVDRCQLTRCDGNGIFIGGYARDVRITRNDFNWLGESAMAAFGWTSRCLYANCSATLPDRVGPDGRGGDQPRGTLVAGNLVREIGVWQKQSSAWFQALAAATTLESNVIFNGPRAGVNFNDGFAGGDRVVGNLVFNMVRETVDHGTLNAWERGPYISDVGMVPSPGTAERPTAAELAAGATPGFQRDASGRGSVLGQYRTLAHNFLLGTYNVNSNLETDDGASRYLMHGNYFVFGSSATDFAMNAHRLYQVGNVYAYPQSILTGWEPRGSAGPPATDCFVYNATFFLLGDHSVCTGKFRDAMLDSSVLHTVANRSRLEECGPAATGTVLLRPPMPDAAVTAAAKAALGRYPKPFSDS